MARAGIHPKYELATITCACGAVYETASTRGSYSVEICAKCHPFYTGRQKLIDSAGRIERFQKRYQLKPGAVSTEGNKAPKSDKEPRPAPTATERPAKAEGAERPAKAEKAPRTDKPADKAPEKAAPAKQEAKGEAKAEAKPAPKGEAKPKQDARPQGKPADKAQKPAK